MVLFALWRPSKADEQRLKYQCSSKDLNYTNLGGTKDPSLLQELKQRGWVLDRTSVQVGKGPRAFRAATDCLQRWGHFQLGWTGVDPATSTQAGAQVVVTSKTLFLWSCNPLRIVYSERREPPRMRLPWQPRPPRSFSFAHGCLQGHMLTGEEAFRVEMRPDGSVWYDITTFSKPSHPLAIGFYPLLRHFQKKFASESARAVTWAVATAEKGT
ncbi:hypothetical protein PLESTB_000396200 [Pleodorina starrii]|uniref:DUF1990 domain-containing protein n=1 Tax=Pleodorina starrii TaxID=330485 RepID=A0A9W6BF10_9CHLO|nr:hypothetical protein PLESTM_001492200 [Pleodorina starrii]GLC50585.1 hypothetical protein PLESTB_000396200 [Pleodorina starrii]GLC73177.1 hypothetical protein PLESTF_001343700 [Pleodorina starrii]